MPPKRTMTKGQEKHQQFIDQMDPADYDRRAKELGYADEYGIEDLGVGDDDEERKEAPVAKPKKKAAAPASKAKKPIRLPPSEAEIDRRFEETGEYDEGGGGVSFGKKGKAAKKA